MRNQTQLILHLIAWLLSISLATGQAKQIENGDFEQGLTGWNHDGNTYPIGSFGQPIGFHGYSAANLGTFDQPGSSIWQSSDVEGGKSYKLKFAIAANAVGVIGRTAAVQVKIDAGITTGPVDQTFSVLSKGYPNGSLGFEQKEVAFTVPQNTTFVTITFRDVSPSNGAGVDLMIDTVILELTGPGSPPSFVVEPADQIAELGDSLRMTAKVAGTSPIFYSWYHDATLLQNQTADTLLLTGIDTHSAGSYWVIATNAWGSSTSRFATLKVNLTGNLLSNGSFENGLTGWDHDASASEIGAGVNGVKAANLGTFDQPGSFIQQSFPITGCSEYEVRFAAAANAVTVVGKTSIVEVAILRSNGTPIAKQVFSTVSQGLPSGDKGFSRFAFKFHAPAARDEEVRLRITDISANFGRGIDSMIDAVSIKDLGPSPIPVVLPPNADNKEDILSSYTLALGTRYQEVFDRSFFTNGPVLVRGFRFRPDSLLGTSLVGTLRDLSIKLCTTSVAPGNLSMKFNANLGRDAVIVYEGDWTFSTQYQGPEDGPMDFDISVDFRQPFYYQPSNGSLLFDISHQGASADCLIVDSIAQSNLVQRISSYGYPFSDTALNSESSATVIELITCPSDRLDPLITQQPKPSSVIKGQSAKFKVAAFSETPLSYQWFYEGLPIQGKVSSELVLESVTRAERGKYSVLVANQYSTVLSEAVSLEVVNPPTLIEALAAKSQSGDELVVQVVGAMNGDESGVAFSATFDPKVLSFMSVAFAVPPEDTAALINTNQVSSGKLGIAMARDPGKTFPEGTNTLLNLRFKVADLTSATSTLVSFGNIPVFKETVNVEALTLPTVYSSSQIEIAFSGLEGDVVDTGSSDNPLTLADWVQAGRFIAKLAPIPSPLFQRLDCSPKEAKGDGIVDLRDWVQVGRFVSSEDRLLAVGGPKEVHLQGDYPLLNFPSLQDPGVTDINLGESSISNGKLLVPIKLVATGAENAASFSIHYPADALRFTRQWAVQSAGPQPMNFINNSLVDKGFVGFTLALPPLARFSAEARILFVLEFEIVGNPKSALGLQFVDQPLSRSVVSSEATPLRVNYQNEVVAPADLKEKSLKIELHPQGLLLVAQGYSDTDPLQWSKTASSPDWHQFDVPLSQLGTLRWAVISNAGPAMFFRATP